MLRAANGREMWCRNTSAPRLLHPMTGDFAVQTVISPALDDRPWLGGLLVWRDEDNFLQLEGGRLGVHQYSFRGRVGGSERIVGRGMLERDRVFLRLERRNHRIRALCSPDGETWYTLGKTEVDLGAQVQVGLFAIGFIVRDFYLGAFPEGSAIRFEDTRLWQ